MICPIAFLHTNDLKTVSNTFNIYLIELCRMVGIALVRRNKDVFWGVSFQDLPLVVSLYLNMDVSVGHRH